MLLTQPALDKDFIITPHLVRAIFNTDSVISESLIANHFVPITIGELDGYGGYCVEVLKLFLQNGKYLDDCRVDYTCHLSQENKDKLNLLYPTTPRYMQLPNEVRWVEELGMDRMSVTSDSSISEFNYEKERLVCSSVKQNLMPDRTFFYRQQYHPDGALAGIMTLCDHNPQNVVKYTGFISNVGYHRIERPICHQSIKKDVWKEIFGMSPSNVRLNDVQSKISWDEFQYRESLRVTNGIDDGDFSVTRHSSSIPQRKLHSVSVESWAYRDKQLYMRLCGSRFDFNPSTNYYRFDNGNLLKAYYGNGTRLNYNYELSNGRLVRLEVFREHIMGYEKINQNGEGLFEYVKPI